MDAKSLYVWLLKLKGDAYIAVNTDQLTCPSEQEQGPTQKSLNSRKT
jgi:hypothetical protein